MTGRSRRGSGSRARKPKPGAAGAGCLLLLGLAGLGCAGVRPRVEPAIEAPVPKGWRTPPSARTSPEADDSTAASRDWWRTFNDFELNRLIELALESNRDLRSAAARLDGALAQARIAGAARKPQAGLSTDAARRRQNFIGLPIPGAEGGVLSTTSTNLGVSLNVSWEVDLWGRIGDTRRAARARAEAANHDLDAARLSLTGQTAKAWFALLEASHQVTLADETLANHASVRARIETRYRQGLRTALDLRLAAANEANAEARQAARTRQRDAIRRQLEILVARDPEALEIIHGTTAGLPALPPAPGPGLPSDVLGRRPDIGASERRLAAAGLDIDAARKLLYPRLTLGGSSGAASRDVEDLTDPDFSVWSLAAGLLQPLFQGGRLRAAVALSEATQRSVLAQHESAIIRAVTDVEEQLADDFHLEVQQRAVAKAKRASYAAQDLAQDRYFSGLSDYLSVLAAQVQATATASQLSEVDRLRLEQRVDLHLALGGGGGGEGPDDAATTSRPADQTPPTSVVIEESE